MAKALMESLSIDLPALAQIIRAKGRGRDTVLAHITPKEAALLKKRGGSGTINPDTGLPQFDDFVGDISAPQDVAPVSPVYDISQPGGALTQVAGGQGQQYTAGGAGYAPTADIPAPTDQTYINAQNYNPIVSRELSGPIPQGQAIPQGTGTVYAPTTLTPIQLGQAAVGESPYPQPAPSAPTTPTQAKTDQEKVLGMSPDTLARLGLATGLGLYGTTQARKAAGQVQAATGEQKALATPYQSQGQELVRAAQAGELTPSSMQSYKAAQAQLAQQVSGRGGVGAEQAATQLEALRQNLLQNQYNYGLQVSQIGDNIALGAIRTGMQLDQNLNAASNQFYTSLASIAAGLPMRIA
ncbi:hypothetical protein [Bacteriophage sp.]|nr:hypothetical protein [Bacteriophage sp.]